MRPVAKSYIMEIEPYRPGKSKIDHKQKVIKLSSNENALGTSPKAIEFYKDHSDKIFRYADGSCRALRKAIAKKYHLDDMDRIVCGAGSDEILNLLAQSFAQIDDEIIYSQYGFLMYPIVTRKVGAKAIVAKETNLKTDINNILGAVNEKTKIIFLANPNNPTGSYLNDYELESLIRKVPKNIILVLDMAYAEFVERNDYSDGIKLVDKYENVVMLRTFSKIYGMASLRLGWCYSSAYIADVLNRCRDPFNVGGAAQAAGIGALTDDEFTEKSMNHHQKWRKIVSQELTNIGLKIYDSVTNFILIDFLDIEKCLKANEYLLDNGIILREMNSYNLPNCLRMSMGKEEENLQVIELLSKF